MNTEPLDPVAGLELDRRLAALRHGLREVTAPPALEAALLRRFRGAHARSRPALWWMPPLALAATVAVTSWIVRGAVEGAQGVPAPASAPPASEPGPFLALRPLDRIALEPATTVVATEFPRALLAEWGLPVAPDRAAEPVRAELLYSASGEALAVRLLP